MKLPEATYLCENLPRKGNAVRFTADDQLSSWNSEEALAITDPSVTADAILIHEVSNYHSSHNTVNTSELGASCFKKIRMQVFWHTFSFPNINFF